MRLPLALAGAALLAVLGATVVATPASAHDSLVSSSPADRSTVARTPAEVVLTFDEPAIAMGTRLIVTGPNGEVQQGAARLVDSTVTQALAPGSPAGAYTVEWRVTSADGHPVSGVLSFSATAAGAAGASTRPVPVDAAPTTAGSRPSAGWLWVVVGIVVVGMAAVAVRSRRRRTAGGEPAEPRTTVRSTSKEKL